MSAPSDPAARVTALLAAASTVDDLDVRAVYLATARTILTAARVALDRSLASLAAMEAELARVRRAKT